MTYDVDFFVIGAGSGGVRAARIAAQHGARSMIAEDFRVGGTCVIRGCVPKKLLVYASRFADDFADAAGYGWELSPAHFDWPRLVRAKEKEISRLSMIYRANLAAAGVELVEERAAVAGPHAINLSGGRQISARHILIATGSRPQLASDIPGLEYAVTSNEIFDLKSFPRRLLIVGGGYIAVEFASIFQRLGAAVTLTLRGNNILRGFDEDMRTGLRDALKHAGVGFAFGDLPTRIDRLADHLHVSLQSGGALDVDQVLVATGRQPNTASLGLAGAGVALTERGGVKVDKHSTSSVASIHAVGDVTNRVELTPVAIREGHVLADHLFGGGTQTVNHANIASAVFTTPELGSVGLTQAQAQEQFEIVDIYRSSFRPMKATLSGREEQTIMKLVVDGVSDRLLGAHILGHEAGEMIQLLAIALAMGAKKSDLDSTMAVHPTAAEELVTMRSRSARHRR